MTRPSHQQVPLWVLNEFARRGDDLTSAGIGLRGIGLMLSERDLSRDEENALVHAVMALGAMVDEVGRELFSQATKQGDEQ